MLMINPSSLKQHVSRLNLTMQVSGIWSLVHTGSLGDPCHFQDSLSPCFSHWELGAPLHVTLLWGWGTWGEHDSELWENMVGPLELEWRPERPLLPPLCATAPCLWLRLFRDRLGEALTQLLLLGREGSQMYVLSPDFSSKWHHL